MEIPEGKIIGIDLGTTNSLVAMMEGSEPVIIPNAEGGNKTPSVVSFMENEDVSVGEIARRQAVTNPSRTISSIKRLMGRTFNDIQESGERFPFKITEKNNQLLIDIDGMGYKPEQISALIIQKLKEAAEKYLNESIQQTIITVPAYFDDLQRNATKQAAGLADLEVLRLVNEPTAAAMAYGLDKETEELVAVYDFGGGTFDISILEIDHNAFEVLVSNGDTHLGGDDLDNALVQWIVDDFNTRYGINVVSDPVTLYRLKEVAEKAKCELSTAKQTLISLPFIAYHDKSPLHLEKMIKRHEFEDLVRKYVHKTIECCRVAMEEANLTKKDISKVILVGGSSRIPLVYEEVENFFGKSPFKGVNPDEIVALGAATQAGIFAGNLEEVVLLDITPHSMGVEVKDNKVSKIIEKNSTVPIKAAKTFTTTEDNQTFVNIHVVQGEHEDVSENRSLGKFTLSDIEPALAGTPRIRISFFINADGVLEISANDMASGKEKSLTITHSFLSSEERKKRRRLAKPTILPRKGKAGVKEEKIAPPEGIQLQAIPSPKEEEPSLPELYSTFRILQEGSQESPFLMPAPTTPPPETTIPAADSELELDKASTITESQEVRDLPPPKTAAARPVLDPELEEQLKKYLSSEERGEEAVKTYMRFAERVNEMLDQGREVPSSIYPVLAKTHILSRFPEEARNVLIMYQKIPGYDDHLALDAYEMFVKYFPDFTFAHREMARLYRKLNNLKLAIKSLETIQKKRSEEEIADDLEQVYSDYLRTSEDSVVKFKLVKVYLKKKRLDEAIELLQDLINGETYRDRALRILGLTYFQKKMFLQAWQAFKLFPDTNKVTDTLYRLANEFEDQGNLGYALEVYRHLQKEIPNYKDVDAKYKKVAYRMELKKQEEDQQRGEPILEDSRFIILEEVNRGSMGVIYKAQDKVVGDIVAIKLLNDYLCQDPTAVKRFKSEARATKKLSHPHIVRIHDMFESGRKLFLSMEYIEGTDLKRMLASKIQFSEDMIRHYFLQIADALAYAHSLGIIHRDIKPANVMITPFNTVKITDFGIAKILKTDAITKSGTAVIGTPLYMAPEQIIGKNVDARSDIYALGIMLYEMVGGHPPFSEGNIEYHHVNTEAPLLEGDISDVFRAVIMKMIQKKQEERYQSIQEIFSVLKEEEA